MAEDEIRRRGDRVPSGEGRRFRQTRQVGAERGDRRRGIDNLGATSSTSGGAAARIEDDVRKPNRAGGERDDVPPDLKR